MASQFPAIPEPAGDTAALLQTVRALKEAVETLTGQRGVGVDTLIKSSDMTRAIDGAEARIADSQQIVVNDQVALASRVTVVESSIGGTGPGSLGSRVTTVEQAITNPSESIGSRVTTVESRANTATATGQIGLRTAAGGSGATAAYEMFLTSGSVSVGMRAEATSGGGRIVFTAGQFLLSDPAYGQAPVFVWNSATGRFAFNVPLLINGNVAINGDATINGDAVVNGTLTGAKIVDTSVPGEKLNNNAVSNTMSAVATTSGNPLLDQVSVAVPLRAGARAVVIGTAVPIGVTSYGGGGTALVGTMAIRVNGSDLTNIPVFQSVLSAPSNGEFGSSPGEAAITATADQALYTAPSAGTYTFTLFHSQSSFPKRLTITVTELFK